MRLLSGRMLSLVSVLSSSRVRKETVAAMIILPEVLLTIGALVACHGARNNVSLKTTTLAVGVLDAELRHLLISRGNAHVVSVRASGDKVWVVSDGVEGRRYDNVAGVLFSPNGAHLAYFAQRGRQWLVVVDGVEGKPYDFVGLQTLVFNPDGNSLAYGAGYNTLAGNRQFVVLNNREGAEYNSANGDELTCVGGAPCIRFSPNGQRLAYALRRHGRIMLVVDSVEGREYDAIGLEDTLFSPDSRHTVYPAQRGSESVLVVDGAEARRVYSGKPQPFRSFSFSADGKHLAYQAWSHHGWFSPVIDAVEFPEHQVAGSVISFSPDGRRTAYSIYDGQGQCMVTDGKQGPRYASVGGVEFSPDGRHVIYPAYDGAKWLTVLDGVEGRRYERVEWTGLLPGSVFSPNGAHTAVRINHGGKQFVVLDGVEQKKYDEVSGAVFSPDSKRTAYRAKRRAKCLVVVDGSESESYDGVEWTSIGFSPDSRHIAYIAANKGRGFIVVDGVEANGFDAYLGTSLTRGDRNIPVERADIYHPLAFARKNLLYAIGREGNKILRTEVEILEK